MQNNLFQATGESLNYELPHGQKLFSNISFTWNFRRCGLVGPNGVGKSTFARLLAREILFDSGELQISHQVVYLAQMQEPPAQTVAEYLNSLWENTGIDPVVLGLLLGQISLERDLRLLSGGEWTRVRIAEALSRAGGLLILDEPTNNLDRQARTVLIDFVRSYRGPLLIISHDRELLEEVDGIWELSSLGLACYGGGFSFYEEQKEAERSVLNEKINRARLDKKKLEREHQEKLRTQEKRMRQGQRLADRGGLPRILIGNLKRQAQETQGRIQLREEKRVEDSRARLFDLISSEKTESILGLDFSEGRLAEGKMVFELSDFNLGFSEGEYLWAETLTCSMQGPRRWALSGANGSGKSSLIDALTGRSRALTKGVCRLGGVRVQLLDQRYSLLDFEGTVFDNVFESSRFDRVETRSRLARFQFFKEMVYQRVADLSGGERLKAALAKILLSTSEPQLLILDEPTNSLDLQSLQILEKALNSYSGALLVVSHDEVFLARIGIEHVLHLEARKESIT